MSSDPLDGEFAPRRAAAVFTLTLDDEAVLLDEVQNRLHHLNPTAALLWSCFDGNTTVAQIAAEISLELGLPEQTVLVDTLELVRTLQDEGLLGLHRTTSAVDDPGAEPHWQRHPDVLWRRSLDTVMFMPAHEAEPRTLGGAGPAVWDLLAEHSTVADLVTALADTHVGDVDEIEADLRSTLVALERLGAVERLG